MAIFEVLVSESFVARRRHMLSLTCFDNQAERSVHTATRSSDQRKILFEIGLSDSSKDKKSSHGFLIVANKKKKKLEQPFCFTYAVPPGDRCETVPMPHEFFFFKFPLEGN
jgi:hypothetical protein